MRVKITCPFTLPSSHEIHEVGFRGGNNLKLVLPFGLEGFLGIEGTALEITEAGNGKYEFVIISDSLFAKEQQVSYIEKAVEYISFLINKNEHNPHYGTNFIRPEWFDLKTVRINEHSDPLCETIAISDSVAISSTRTVKLRDAAIPQGQYHDLMRFYFDGLKAEYRKSKYFHWFLILEYLENTKKYKSMFAADKLFSESECQQLRELADSMGDSVKKGAITHLLSRTKESRNQKMLKLLNALGIKTITGFGNTEEIDIGTIKRIVNGRNALFHSGSEFPEMVLWVWLFSLATQIVECVAHGSACLDA